MLLLLMANQTTANKIDRVAIVLHVLFHSRLHAHTPLTLSCSMDFGTFQALQPQLWDFTSPSNLSELCYGSPHSVFPPVVELSFFPSFHLPALLTFAIVT